MVRIIALLFKVGALAVAGWLFTLALPYMFLRDANDIIAWLIVAMATYCLYFALMLGVDEKLSGD